MKMAIQYWLNRGQAQAQTVRLLPRRLSRRHARHDGDLRFRDRHPSDMFAGCCTRISWPLCRRTTRREAALVTLLERHADELAGIIVEPLVQGAGGMRFHDPEVLRRLRRLADRFDLLLIFDEIFTGFGRTGAMFACESAGVVPDIITLSKALTGGTLPLAATVASSKVFDAFWSDDPMHALMHGPTYMANALGLRGRQCLARSVRGRRAARSRSRASSDGCKRGLAPAAICRAWPMCGCAAPSAWSSSSGSTISNALRRALCRGGRLHPPDRQRDLSRAGADHRSGRCCVPDAHVSREVLERALDSGAQTPSRCCSKAG